MNRRLVLVTTIAFAVAGWSGCATYHEGWVVLIDGERGLENFDRIGDANWRAEKGAIVADKGKGGHLVSKSSYKDFILRAEFYAEANTNSGIFIRASDPKKVGAANAYEANIWDTRPDPTYAYRGHRGICGSSRADRSQGGRPLEYDGDPCAGTGNYREVQRRGLRLPS